jgi:hypothetical protein
VAWLIAEPPKILQHLQEKGFIMAAQDESPHVAPSLDSFFSGRAWLLVSNLFALCEQSAIICNVHGTHCPSPYDSRPTETTRSRPLECVLTARGTVSPCVSQSHISTARASPVVENEYSMVHGFRLVSNSLALIVLMVGLMRSMLLSLNVPPRCILRTSFRSCPVPRRPQGAFLPVLLRSPAARTLWRARDGGYCATERRQATRTGYPVKHIPVSFQND